MKTLKKTLCIVCLTALLVSTMGANVLAGSTDNGGNSIGMAGGMTTVLSNNLMKISSFEGVTANTYGLNLHNTVATDSNYWDVNGAGDSSANTTGIVNDVYHTGSASLRVDESNASWTKTDTSSGRPRIKVMNINEVSNIGGLMSADKQATVSVWLKAVDNVSSWTMCIGTDAHHNADPMDFRLKRLYKTEADGTNWVNLTAEIDFSQFDYSMFPDSGVCTGGTGSYDSSTKESVLDARWTIQIWANRTDESSNASYYVDDFDIFYVKGSEEREDSLIQNIVATAATSESNGVYTFGAKNAWDTYLTINTTEPLMPGEWYELDFQYKTNQSSNGTLQVRNEAESNYVLHRTSHSADAGNKERHMGLSRKFTVAKETSILRLTHSVAVTSFVVSDISLTKATDNTYKPLISGNKAKVQFLNIVKDFNDAVVKIDGAVVDSTVEKVNSKVLSVTLPANLTADEHTLEVSGVKCFTSTTDTVNEVSGTLKFNYSPTTEVVEAAIYNTNNCLEPITVMTADKKLASVKLTNLGSADKSFAGTIIFAGYNGDTLKTVVTKDYTTTVGDGEWRIVDLEADLAGCTTAKMFVWDSLTGLEPLVDNIDLLAQ